MTYPAGSGIPIVSGGASWGTTVTAPAGAILGTTDTQTVTNKSIDASQLTSGSVPAARIPDASLASSSAAIKSSASPQVFSGELSVNADLGPGLNLGSGALATNYAQVSGTRAFFGYKNGGGLILQSNAIQFQQGPTFGTGTYYGGYEGSLVPSLGVAAAVASAATIAPTGGGVIHITGNTAISTITVPAGCTIALHGCQFTFVSDGGFPLATGGNIAVAVTTAIGQMLSLTYDPATSKWYPSAGANLSNAITSATAGTGVTSVTCATATCTNLRGSYTVVAGTATTGTIFTLVWPTTTTPYVCTVNQNDNGVATAYLGLGHSVATATGMTVSAGISAIGTTFNVDYSCQP